jgi:hypothetical protein
MSETKSGFGKKAGTSGEAQRSGPNEGEGSQTGARQYNEATREFVANGKVKKAADDAAKAVSGPEAEALKRAEAEGKRHSHGEDPALRKN